MRPTYLQFRSPKERTPFGYEPLVLNNGKITHHSLIPKKRTFSQTDRFHHYKFNFSQAFPKVGPGAYENDQTSIQNKRIPGGNTYKLYHNNLNTTTNDYYYVGNTLVYDEKMSPRRRRQSQETPQENSTRGTESRLRTTDFRPITGNSIRSGVKMVFSPTSTQQMERRWTRGPSSKDSFARSSLGESLDNVIYRERLHQQLQKFLY